MVKRILVNFVALHGGGTADAFQMVAAMAEQGCEIYALLSKNMENYNRWKSIKGIRIIEINGYTNKFNFLPRLISFCLSKTKVLKKIIKDNNIKYAYIPMISFWTYFIHRKLRKMNLKCVYTMHDVIPHDNKSHTLIWKWSKRIAFECDEIVVLSNCYKEVVQKTFNKELSRIHVIPLGNQDYYGDVLDKKPTNGVFELVFYGRIDAYKGLDVLAEAYRELLKKHNNLHLTIAGSGDFSPYSAGYSRINQDNVTIVNRWIKDSEVPTLFAFEKSITIIPYKNATQSGVIPIAMQHKSLVVSTNCSGLIEQIEDKKTGLLFEPNNVKSLVDTLEFAITNWNLMEHIINNAFFHIKDLSWDKLATKLLREIDHDNN